MMTVLVTGARGFVGRALVSALRERGCDVHEYDFSLGHDVCDASSLQAFDGDDVEVVIHLAGQTYVPNSWDNPELFYKTNALGTQNVLEYCRRNNSRMINVSAYVYGAPLYTPIDEKHPAKPNNPYAHSKLVGEQLCEFYRDHYGIRVITVRPFNIFGVGQNSRFLIPHICRQAVCRGAVTLENLSPRRDYLHVRDFAALCLAIMDYTGAVTIFNAGCGVSYSVREILDMVIKLVQKPISVKETGVCRHNEIDDTVAACALAGQELGWIPEVSMEEGLSEIINDMIGEV